MAGAAGAQGLVQLGALGWQHLLLSSFRLTAGAPCEITIKAQETRATNVVLIFGVVER